MTWKYKLKYCIVQTKYKYVDVLVLSVQLIYIFFLLRATAVVRRLHKGGMIALHTSLVKSRFNLFLTQSKLHVEAQI